MPILQLDNLGSGGIIKDTPAYELPLNAFSDGQNVRLRDRAVQRTEGYSPALDTPTVPPYWLLPWQDGTNYFWFYCGASKIYRTEGSISTEVTRSGGGDYTSGVYPRWNGGVLGGVPVLNHSNLGSDYPQEWDGIANFQDMTNWPQGAGGDPTWYTKVIRVFKNFLVALYMQENSTVYPVRLRWCDATDPGAVPGEWLPAATNLAGSKTFSDTTAPLVDCLPLRDVNIVYKEDSVHLMQYVGGNFVFNFRQAFSEFGLMSQRCVKPFFGKHFTVSFGDVILHDGQQAQSIADKTMRREIFDMIEPVSYENCFVMVYPKRTEIWLCVPTVGSGLNAAPNYAYIWNWAENKWTEREIPLTSHIGLGVVQEITAGLTFDLLPGTFDSLTGTFDARQYNPSALEPLLCDVSSPQFHLVDDGTQDDGVDFTAYVERTGLAINGGKGGEITVDPHTIKFVRRVYLKVEADPGVILTVKIGGQDYPGGPVTWTSYQFNPQRETYVSCRVQGKLLAYHVGSDDAGNWKLFSVGFDMDVIGTQ